MIFEDERFTVDSSDECVLPGYLVLRVKGGETSLAQLAPEKARALGEMLAKTAAAVEEAVGAERVYVLSFCEVDRRLHFHLFPRTAWLLKAFRRANGGRADAVSGPALFEWARRNFVQGRRLPVGMPGAAVVAAAVATARGRKA